MRTKAAGRIAALGVGLAALLLTGCSGDSGDSAAQSVAEDHSASSGMEPGAAADREAAGSTSDADQSKAQTIADTEINQRHLIKTGTMTISTGSVQAAADRAANLLTGGEGYVGTTHTTSNAKGEAISIQLVLRVPVEDYDRVVAAIKRLGTLTLDEHETTDVTEELTDVESRIASQESSIERLRTLMANAGTVGEVIQVESELATREADLESLQSRQATLAGQAALSTLNVTFEKPEADDTEPEPATGFLAGLGTGWTALVASVQVALTVLGVVLPFVVAFAVIGAGPLWLWQRARARRRAPEQPQPSAAG